MIHTMVLVLVSSIAHAGSKPVCFEARPGSPFAPSGTGHCYLLVDNDVPRDIAAEHAAQEGFAGEDGHLVEVNSAAEQAFLEGLIGSAGPYWMGGTCTSRGCVDGVTWDSGDPASFSDLCENVGRGSDLVWANGCWTVGGSSSRYGYIVEFPVDPVPNELSILTCDDQADLQRCYSLACYKNGAGQQCGVPPWEHPFGVADLCVVDPAQVPPDCASWAWYVGDCALVSETVGGDVDCVESEVDGDLDPNEPGDSGCRVAPVGGGVAGLWLILGLVRRRRR